MPKDARRLPFEIDDAIDPTLVTGRAGVPLRIELFRHLGVAATIDAEGQIKQRQRGLRPSQLGASLIALWVAGGDRCQHLTTLREDQALASLLGYALPAATRVRDFLEAFHVDDPPLWPAGPQAAIREESAPLAGLGQANRTLVTALQRGARGDGHPRRGCDPPREPPAGRPGGLRRDPGLPAGGGPLGRAGRDPPRPVPGRPRPRRLRERACPRTGGGRLAPGPHPDPPPGDSALSDHDVLRWCEAPQIEYGISADLSEHLRAEIQRLLETAWQGEREDPEAIRAWAEVPYVPDDTHYRKQRPCLRRYLAVRVQKRQGSLVAEGSAVHYCAVVTNRAGGGLALLQWHREKAGTVEHAHHVLKNELAAAALTSGKFGANAAWFRLNVLTYNLLTALKRLTLPGDLRTARPKRLWFLLSNTVGKVVPHARRTLLRLTGVLQHALVVRIRHRIAALAPT
ncbi:MAG: transposase [candidate division NC10 bacterium]|nr:transposase [candidate division NC10 bacterium]